MARGSRWPAVASALTAAMLVFASTAPPGLASERPRVGPEVPVTATNLKGRPANNSPVLAVDPTDHRFVALANRLDNPDFGCALHVSGDAGRSWLPARPFSKLPKGVEKCYGPEIAFDGDGRLFLVFVGLKDPGNRPVGAYLTSTADRGRSWAPPQRILGPLRFQVRMAIDQRSGRMNLVWLEARAEPSLGGFAPVANPIMSAFSDDGGRRFSRPVQVSDPDRARVVAPALALGAGGRVHLAYYDLGADAPDYQGLEGPPWPEPWSLVMASSTDGGRHFSKGMVVDDDIVPPERVMLIFTMVPAAIATDDSGRVYVAWHDARNEHWDVFIRASPDGGRKWGPPRRLNDDPKGNRRHQYLPRLGVAPDGRVDAVFYDRRNAKDNLGNDLYYAYSENEGRTFSPNVRLTTTNFDTRVGARYANASAHGLFEFGARIAVASERHRALAAWTDTRNTAALGRPGQDIYAAEVRLTSEGPDREGFRSGPAVVLGAVALVVLGPVVFFWRRRTASHARSSNGGEPE